ARFSRDWSSDVCSSDLTVVLAAALVSAAAALLVAAAPAPGVAVAGVVLLGLAVSGLFPTVLGIASARFRENSGTVFGILFTIAQIGRASRREGVGGAVA